MTKTYLPSFLYIGPPKSASSWLYEVLASHPEVFVPTAKDIYYFDRYYHRGPTWYSRHFASVKGGVRAIGELSHDYMYSRDAIGRIANDLPHVRLISILRNPVDRAISHYKFSARHGNVRGSLRDACVQNPNILECGRYAKYLRRYFDSFEAARIHVLSYDHLVSDEQGFARTVFRAIGVDEGHLIERGRRVNAASAARSVGLAKLAKRGSVVMRTLGLSNAVGIVKRSRISSLLYRPIRVGEFEITAGDRDWLRDYYSRDIEDLQQLLGWTLEAWST